MGSRNRKWDTPEGSLGVKDYKKNGLTRGPERELPLLQPVKIELNWTSRVYIDTIDIYIYIYIMAF